MQSAMTGFLSCAAWATCEHPTRTRCAIFRVGVHLRGRSGGVGVRDLNNTTAPGAPARFRERKRPSGTLFFLTQGCACGTGRLSKLFFFSF